MNNTKPKEILENIINVMEKTNVDEWEIDKLTVVLNYINELETNRDKAIEYMRSQYTITDDDLYLALYSSDGTLDKLENILRGKDNGV